MFVNRLFCASPPKSIMFVSRINALLLLHPPVPTHIAAGVLELVRHMLFRLSFCPIQFGGHDVHVGPTLQQLRFPARMDIPPLFLAPKRRFTYHDTDQGGVAAVAAPVMGPVSDTIVSTFGDTILVEMGTHVGFDLTFKAANDLVIDGAIKKIVPIHSSRLETTGVKTMTITLKYKHVPEDASLGFYCSGVTATPVYRYSSHYDVFSIANIFIINIVMNILVAGVIKWPYPSYARPAERCRIWPCEVGQGIPGRQPLDREYLVRAPLAMIGGGGRDHRARWCRSTG